MSSKISRKFAIAFMALLAGSNPARGASATQTTTYTNTNTYTYTGYTSYTNTQTYTVTSTFTDTSQSVQQQEAYKAYVQTKEQAQALMNTGYQWEIVGLMVMANAQDQGTFMEGVMIYYTGVNIYNDGLRVYNSATYKQGTISTNTNLMYSMSTGVRTNVFTSTGTSESYRLTSASGDGSNGKNGLDGENGSGGDGIGRNATGIKVDPSLLRDGQFENSLAELAAKTGMNPDDLADALKNGDALDMAAKNSGRSEAQVQEALDAAKSGSMNFDGLKEKYADLANGLGGSGASSDSTYSLAGGVGGGGGRGLASSDLSSLAGGANGRNGDSAGGNVKVGKDKGKISPNIQAAFDRAGITDLTIFQIVHRQYIKKTPMMFGTEAQVQMTPQKNPFAKSPFEGLEKDPSNLSL